MFFTDKKSANSVGLGVIWAVFMFGMFFQPIQSHILSPVASTLFPLHSLKNNQVKNSSKEVFGFLPHWNFNNAGNIDFDTLTTL
jgi:hypothetical protein